MSTGSQFLLTSVFALTVALINAIAMLRARRRAKHAHKPVPEDRPGWIMVGVLALGAGGFLFQIPSVYTRVDHLLHVPNASIVVAYLSFLSCEALIHVWIGTWPGTTPRGLRAMTFALAAAAVALIALFAFGTHPVEHPLSFDTDYIHDPASGAFVSIYLTLFGLGWPWAAWRVHKAREKNRDAGKRWLVHGLAFLETGMWFTVAYSVTLALVPLSVALDMPEPSWAAPASSAFAAVSATCSCIGFSCRTWGTRWDNFLTNRYPGRDERFLFRLLQPLYRLVSSATPAEDRQPPGLGVVNVNPGAALAYQVLQIREGSELLAKHVSPEGAARAVEMGTAVAFAMMLQDGAENARAGRAPHGAVELPEIPATPEGYGRVAAALAAVELLRTDHHQAPSIPAPREEANTA